VGETRSFHYFSAAELQERQVEIETPIAAAGSVGGRRRYRRFTAKTE
jgi:hypothetical protein